jgi:hypothetical protein
MLTDRNSPRSNGTVQNYFSPLQNESPIIPNDLGCPLCLPPDDGYSYQRKSYVTSSTLAVHCTGFHIAQHLDVDQLNSLVPLGVARCHKCCRFKQHKRATEMMQPFSNSFIEHVLNCSGTNFPRAPPNSFDGWILALNQLLQHSFLVAKNVMAIGNCFYEAVAVNITFHLITQMPHKDLWNLIKNAIFEFYESNPELSSLVEGLENNPTLAQWVARQSATNEYADHPEIVVFSLITGLHCSVFDLDKEGSLRKSKVTIERTMLDNNYVRGPQAASLAALCKSLKSTGTDILLARHSSEHYAAVLPLNLSSEIVNLNLNEDERTVVEPEVIEDAADETSDGQEDISEDERFDDLTRQEAAPDAHSIGWSSLTSHGKLFKNVPHFLKKEFVSQAQQRAQAYSLAANTKEKDNAIYELARLPSDLLAHGTKIRGAAAWKRVEKRLTSRSHAFRDAGSDLGQRRSLRQQLSALSSEARYGQSIENQSQILSNIAAAKAALASGFIGKAANALERKGGLANTAEPLVMAQLVNLHPGPKDDRPLPHLPPSTRRIIIDPQRLLRHLNAMNRGSAPGMSGWTPAMILMAVRNSELAMSGFCSLLTDIANGEVLDDVREFLCSCELIAAKKDATSIRPLALGETFYRLTARIVKEIGSDTELSSYFGGLQLGIDVSGGSDTIIHNVAHGALRYPEEATLCLDIKMAFQCIDRRALLETVSGIKCLAPCFNFIWLSYANPSKLYTRDHLGRLQQTLNSRQGVRQGDPLGSLLFAIGFQQLLNAVKTEFPDIKIAAYHDDLTLRGPRQSLLRVFEFIRKEALEKLNLSIQPKKSFFVDFHFEAFSATQGGQGIAKAMQDSGVRILSKSALILGCPIAINNDELEKLIEAKLVSLCSLLDVLASEGLSVQETCCIIRGSTIFKFDYFLRCIPPATMSRFAQRFDIKILEVVFEKLSLANVVKAKSAKQADGILERVENQLQDPLSSGGFGITSAAKRAAPSFISSMAVALRTENHINAFADYDKSAHHNGLTWCLQGALDTVNKLSEGTTVPIAQINAASAAHAGRPPKPPDDASQDAKHKGKVQGPPKTAKEFFKLYLNRDLTAIDSKSLSKWLWQRMQKKRKQEANKVLFEASQLERARLLAIRAPGASRWLNASLDQQSNQLSNQDFCSASKFRLGLDQELADRVDCWNCGEIEAHHTDPDHQLSCKQMSALIKGRHDKMRDALAVIARKTGANVRVEERGMYENAPNIPDLVIWLDNVCFHIDFVIVHPRCKSHLQAAQKRQGAAHQAEAAKRSKYKEHPSEANAIFVPFAIETYGGWGDSALEFLAALKVYADKNPYLATNTPDLLDELKDSVACIVQRHNARIAIECRVQSERRFEKSVKAHRGTSAKIKSHKSLNDIVRCNSAGTAAQRSTPSTEVQPIRRAVSAIVVA